MVLAQPGAVGEHDAGRTVLPRRRQAGGDHIAARCLDSQSSCHDADYREGARRSLAPIPLIALVGSARDTAFGWVTGEGMLMRRLVVALLLGLFMLVPIGSASAAHCATIEGSGRADWGGTGTGMIRVVVDGEPLQIGFAYTGFIATGDNTADIFIDFFFPFGVVQTVEHSTNSPIGGSKAAFSSTVDVLHGARGSWSWSGVTSAARGLASIDTLSGTICYR